MALSLLEMWNGVIGFCTLQNGSELAVIQLKDLKDKYLICSAVTTGTNEPCKTSISCPAASVEYLKSAAAIDIIISVQRWKWSGRFVGNQF